MHRSHAEVMRALRASDKHTENINRWFEPQKSGLSSQQIFYLFTHGHQTSGKSCHIYLTPVKGFLCNVHRNSVKIQICIQVKEFFYTYRCTTNNLQQSPYMNIITFSRCDWIRLLYSLLRKYIMKKLQTQHLSCRISSLSLFQEKTTAVNS